jgi:hypothetical protein
VCERKGVSEKPLLDGILEIFKIPGFGILKLKYHIAYGATFGAYMALLKASSSIKAGS